MSTKAERKARISALPGGWKAFLAAREAKIREYKIQGELFRDKERAEWEEAWIEAWIAAHPEGIKPDVKVRGRKKRVDVPVERTTSDKLQEMFLEVFDRLGGVDGMVKHFNSIPDGDRAKTEIYTLIAKLVPKTEPEVRRHGDDGGKLCDDFLSELPGTVPVSAVVGADTVRDPGSDGSDNECGLAAGIIPEGGGQRTDAADAVGDVPA